MNPSEYQAIGDAQRWREQPLPATGLFLCYQQVRFVGEALDGALSQTVPMQLIVSDDGSSDGTAEVLVDRLRDYRGPHQVLLRVGYPNLGLVPHFNRLMERAEGELIVLFAGDDISYPHRVERLVATCLADPLVQVLGSIYSAITEHGESYPEQPPLRPAHAIGLRDYLGANRFLWMAGATIAFRHQLHSIFGPLPAQLWAEDISLFLRGLIIGKVKFLNERLIQYRIVTGSLARPGMSYQSNFEYILDLHRLAWKRVRALADTLNRDVTVAKKRVNADLPALRQLISRHEMRWRAEERLHFSVSALPRYQWILPAVRIMRFREFHLLSVRVLAIALSPGLFVILKKIRRKLVASRSQASARSDPG